MVNGAVGQNTVGPNDVNFNVDSKEVDFGVAGSQDRLWHEPGYTKVCNQASFEAADGNGSIGWLKLT